MMAPAATAMLLMCWTVATVVFPPTQAAPKDSICSENDKPCKNNGDCCGGCCQDGKCAAYSEACVSGGSNPCNTHLCVLPKVCHLVAVQCQQSPCQLIPACKTQDSDYDDYQT